MPFASKKQERFMFSQHPDIAKRWVAEQKAKHAPIVAADLDLEQRIAARMGHPPPRPMSGEDYRRTVAKHYADGDVFSRARAQLAAENGAPAPVTAAPPAAMPLGLQATPATAASPYALLGMDAADQQALETQAHGMNQTIAAESKGGRYRGPTAPQGTPDLVFAQPKPPTAAQTQSGGLPAFAAGGPTPARNIPLVDPKVINDVANAQADERRAQGEMGRAQAQEALDQGNAAAARSQMLGDQQADMQRRAAERDADLQRREAQLDKLSREVADKKVEPFNPSTGDRVRFALMGALGGFMQGYRGMQNNPGLQQMQREIDQYYANQREEIERKKGRIGDMQGLLASAYRRYGNMEQAEAAARVVALQQLDADQQAHAANTQSDKAMAASKQLSAHLQGEQALQLAKLSHYQPAGAGGGGLGDLRVRYQKYAEKWAEGDQKTPKMSFNQYVEQMGGAEHAPTQLGTGARGNPQVADQVAVMNQAVENVNKLRGEDGELPGTGFFSRNLPGNPATSGLRSSEARQVYGALWTVAESLAHANGQRGQEAIDANLKAIVGNGSQEDIDAGLRRAQAVVAARGKAAGMAAGEEEPTRTEDFQPGVE